MKRITLKEAVRFHGHLGPYLVLGLLAGELALKKLKTKKYFGLNVRVFGANKKPKSCLIDGLQLSTGTTYGKGNINKFNGSQIKVEVKVKDKSSKNKLILKLTNPLKKMLQEARTHQDSEELARKLYKTNVLEVFDLTTGRL